MENDANYEILPQGGDYARNPPMVYLTLHTNLGIQPIGQNVEFWLYLTMGLPGRDRWTELRMHGPNWTSGVHPRDSRTEFRRTWNSRSLSAYPSTNRTGLQIDNWIPNRFESITGASTTPAIPRKHRAVTDVSLGRLTNWKSYIVHVYPHAPGIRASDHAMWSYI